MIFIDKLRQRWQRAGSMVCVGLDTDATRLPKGLTHASAEAAVVEFNQRIIDACAPHVCAFKPQFAYYGAGAMEAALAETIAYSQSRYPDIPIILDSKRGDIGSTATQYARESFERYNADAVTVNPYMGKDTVQPFLDYADRGVIVLCRTSNPGSAEFQTMTLKDHDVPLYHYVARQVANVWNANGNCMLVVGATYPDELKTVRGVIGNMPLLVPGIGAQGGDLDAVLAAGLTAAKDGLVINASRSIIYASEAEDFAAAAGVAAQQLKDAICVKIDGSEGGT